MWTEIMEFAVRPHGITDSFKPAGTVAASISVLGAAVSEPVIAWSGAIVAGGTVVIPRLIDWYRSVRAAKREEDAADLAEYNKILALEVSKRVELEAEVRTNRHEIRDLKQQLVWMKAAQAKTEDKVKILTTPDPDAHP